MPNHMGSGGGAVLWHQDTVAGPHAATELQGDTDIISGQESAFPSTTRKRAGAPSSEGRVPAASTKVSPTGSGWTSAFSQPPSLSTASHLPALRLIPVTSVFVRFPRQQR